jgi:perosamine synthetase
VTPCAERSPSAGRPIVPHSRPLLGPEEAEAATRVLRSGRLAPGAEAARLERLLARLSGTADAVGLSSGTMALTLAIRALALGPRDTVAIPTYACAALLHAVRAAGATPVLCDIDPRTLALDPDDLPRRAPKGLRAAILVHPFGLPARPEPFRSRGLLVIEDCAQALGASDRGRPVGSRGDVAVFSLAPTKVITCGGPGGALASPQAGLVRAARALASHDETDDGRPRVNGLMGDLHAAIAATQIEKLPEFSDRRARIAALFDEAFVSLPFERPRPDEGARPIVYRYIVRLEGADRLLERLNSRGVMARRPVHRPLHRLIGLDEPFPAADAAHAELLSLPIYPALCDSEIARVIEEVVRCRP